MLLDRTNKGIEKKKASRTLSRLLNAANSLESRNGSAAKRKLAYIAVLRDQGYNQHEWSRFLRKTETLYSSSREIIRALKESNPSLFEKAEDEKTQTALPSMKKLKSIREEYATVSLLDALHGVKRSESAVRRKFAYVTVLRGENYKPYEWTRPMRDAESAHKMVQEFMAELGQDDEPDLNIGFCAKPFKGFDFK